MQRAILLQTDATKRKAAILKEFRGEAVSLANVLLQHRASKHLMDLHKETYSICKTATRFNSQAICDIERCVVRSRGKTIKAITVKFNMPRNCKTLTYKAGSSSNSACIRDGASPSRYEKTGTSRDTAI